MKNHRTFWASVLAAGLLSTKVFAADEPTTYDYWLDAELEPHPENNDLKSLVEGDTLNVHVDPTRLFPAGHLDSFDLPFSNQGAPPELRGIYVVAPPSGVSAAVTMQPGLCVSEAAAKVVADAQRALASAADKTAKAEAQKTVDQATAKEAALKAEVAKAGADLVSQFDGDLSTSITPSSEVITCSTTLDAWQDHVSGGRMYVCGGDQSVSTLVKKSTDWSLVKKTATGETVCLRSWRLKTDHVLTGVKAEVVVGGNPPEAVNLMKDSTKALWLGTFLLKRDTKEIRLTASFDDGGTLTRIITMKVNSRDTHSLVRIQTALLSTNRLRTVSFAVAATPVRRLYFTEGPSIHCVLLCAVTPIVLLRLSGDDKTLVQLGGGLGLNLSRAFQINGGVLVGTTDKTTAWRINSAWFVGIALDPLILAEVQTSGTSGQKGP